MPVFFPAAALCREFHMMQSTMDMDIGSHVLTTHTRREGDHLHKGQILELVRYECSHLQVQLTTHDKV